MKALLSRAFKAIRKWGPAAWIALCALVVSIYSVYSVREHYRLITEPRVIIEFAFDAKGAGWRFLNNGLGPAEIRQFDVYLDCAHPQDCSSKRDWVAAGNALGLRFEHQKDFEKQVEFAVPFPGSTYAAGTKLKLFWVSPGPNMENLRKNMNRLLVVTCYCSLYEDDCWRTSNTFKRYIGKDKVTDCDFRDQPTFFSPSPSSVPQT